MSDPNGKGRITKIEVERSVKKQTQEFEPEEIRIRVHREIGWDEKPDEAYTEANKWIKDKIGDEESKLIQKKRKHK